MLGIHVESEEIDSWLKDRTPWKNELPVGSYVIDITYSKLYECRLNKTKKCKELIVPGEAKFISLFSKIPTKAKDNLKSRLQVVFEQEMQSHWLTPGRRRSLTPDSPLKKLDLSLSSLDDITPASDNFSATLEIRDAFLCFMVDLLGSYQDYIVKPSSNLNDEVYRSLDEEFMKTRYVDASDRANRPLLSALCNTQMFAAFIQQRQEGRNPGVIFFERAVSVSKGYKWKAPTPLYPLVESTKENQFDRSYLRTKSTAVEEYLERREICRGNDLHLHRGAPLVIPGPESPLNQFELHQPSDCWPLLDQVELSKERCAALKRLEVLSHLVDRHVIEVFFQILGKSTLTF